MNDQENEMNRLRAEIEDLKANQLKSFDVAVPSDEWYDTAKEIKALRAKLDIAVKALESISHKSRAAECRKLAWDALAQIQVGPQNQATCLTCGTKLDTPNGPCKC